MTTAEHFTRLENMMHAAPFMQWNGARVSIAKGEARITLPIRRDFFHAAGAMHGAMYFLALDNAAFFAANSLVKDVFVLTVSFTTYITRPVSEGIAIAVGKVVNQSRTQLIAEAVMHNTDGKEIARGSGIFVKSKIKLSPEIGYL